MIDKAITRAEKKLISRDVAKRTCKQWKPPHPEVLSESIEAPSRLYSFITGVGLGLGASSGVNPKEWLMSKQWRGKLLTGIEGRTVNAQRIAKIPLIDKLTAANNRSISDNTDNDSRIDCPYHREHRESKCGSVEGVGKGCVRHLATSGHLIHLSQFLSEAECKELVEYSTSYSTFRTSDDLYLDADYLVSATSSEVSSKMIKVDSKTDSGLFAKVRQLGLPFMELSTTWSPTPSASSFPDTGSSESSSGAALLSADDERYYSKVKIYSWPQSEKVGIAHHYDDNPYTLLIFLDTLDPDEGGETTFPLLTPIKGADKGTSGSTKSTKRGKAGISIRPQRGDALWFKNDHDGADDSGYPLINTRMVHLGQPIRRAKRSTDSQDQVRRATTLWGPTKTILQLAA